MFTGIIEAVGRVASVEQEGTNLHFEIQAPIANELKIDQSVSHNGVCLTVTELLTDSYKVTAVEETLKKTNLGALTPGAEVNLERCMQAGGRFDGHIVQGHVDATGTVLSIEEREGSWLYRFAFDPAFSHMVVEKGSITINGISLTVFDVSEDSFTVTIIPYTYGHTNMKRLKAADQVNLEFDIVGKYVAKILLKNDK